MGVNGWSQNRLRRVPEEGKHVGMLVTATHCFTVRRFSVVSYQLLVREALPQFTQCVAGDARVNFGRRPTDRGGERTGQWARPTGLGGQKRSVSAGLAESQTAIGGFLQVPHGFPRAILTLLKNIRYMVIFEWSLHGLPSPLQIGTDSNELVFSPADSVPPTNWRLGNPESIELFFPDRLHPRNSRLVLLWREKLLLPGTRTPHPRWGGPSSGSSA